MSSRKLAGNMLMSLVLPVMVVMRIVGLLCYPNCAIITQSRFDPLESIPVIVLTSSFAEFNTLQGNK